MDVVGLPSLAVTLAGCGPHELVGEPHHETTSVPLDNSEVTRVELRGETDACLERAGKSAEG